MKIHFYFSQKSGDTFLTSCILQLSNIPIVHNILSSCSKTVFSALLQRQKRSTEVTFHDRVEHSLGLGLDFRHDGKTANLRLDWIFVWIKIRDPVIKYYQKLIANTERFWPISPRCLVCYPNFWLQNNITKLDWPGSYKTVIGTNLLESNSCAISKFSVSVMKSYSFVTNLLCLN